MNTREEYGDYITFGKLVDGEITELVEDGITTISNYLLSNLSKLVSLSVPNVTSIGESIIRNSGVQELNLNKVTNIPNMALIDNHLTYLDISSATNIGSQALTYNTANNTLETIILSENPISVGNNGLSYLKQLKNLTNFGSISSIGSNCFYNSKLPEELSNDKITTLSDSAFYRASGLKRANFPNVTTMLGRYCFDESSIVSVNLPLLTATGPDGYSFYKCYSLTSIALPSIKTLHSYDFAYCTNLISADLYNVSSLPSDLFRSCSKLTTIILRKDSVVSLSSIWALPNSNESVYVPDELVDSYKNATNWSSIASKIKPISSLPT